MSGYKVKTENRDAIMEIKADALAGKFDILLVFMFDRLGRRDDETPFVVQWFVSHGIRVWSVKEGEQRFDSHVDKPLNYIRFWQASGESEKTAIRVRAKQQQMVLAGEYRGGLVPFGFDAVHLGRVNKKNRPVRDLVRNEEEAAIKAEVYHKIVDEGYGGNRIANWLNERGVKTKRGTTLWRATSVRAMIGNPIDRGQMHLGDTLSEPIEALRIVDDYYFYKAIEIIRERGREFTEKRSVALRTDGSIIAKRSTIRGTASRHIIGTYTAATARRIAKTPVPDSQRTTPRRLKKPYSALCVPFLPGSDDCRRMRRSRRRCDEKKIHRPRRLRMPKPRLKRLPRLWLLWKMKR